MDGNKAKKYTLRHTINTSYQCKHYQQLFAFQGLTRGFKNVCDQCSIVKNMNRIMFHYNTIKNVIIRVAHLSLKKPIIIRFDGMDT